MCIIKYELETFNCLLVKFPREWQLVHLVSIISGINETSIKEC